MGLFRYILITIDHYWTAANCYSYEISSDYKSSFIPHQYHKYNLPCIFTCHVLQYYSCFITCNQSNYGTYLLNATLYHTITSSLPEIAIDKLKSEAIIYLSEFEFEVGLFVCQSRNNILSTCENKVMPLWKIYPWGIDGSEGAVLK